MICKGWVSNRFDSKVTKNTNILVVKDIVILQACNVSEFRLAPNHVTFSTFYCHIIRLKSILKQKTVENSFTFLT